MKKNQGIPQQLNILSLEDSELDFHLICEILTQAGFEYQIQRVDGESEFESCLRSNAYDVILADFNIPGYNSFAALHLCKTLCPNTPYICVSGSIGEEVAIELLKQGAVDYVIKDRPDRLPFAIKRALEEVQEKEIRLQAEHALLQSEENYRHSIAESPLGIRIVTLKGDTVFANKAFLDIYEFDDLEEFNATPAKERYTPESYVEHQDRKAKRAAGIDCFHYDLSIVRKNGEVRHIQVSRKEVLWNGTKHYQVINQDITEYKNLTLELIKAKERAEESDRLKSAFLANMSHEIRTPMNGILGFTELLRTPNLTPENLELYIGIIEKSGTRLLSIINDLIDISKIEAGQVDINLERTNINELLEFIEQFFAPELEQKDLALSVSRAFPDQDAFVWTDRDKLNAVLINLVKNAIKFTHAGSIDLGYRISPDAHSDSRPAPSTLEFFVKDTGIGIKPDIREHIFERFRQGSEQLTRNYEGAGLGLSISKAFVELLGGRIWVESDGTNGSVFYFTLPLNRG